MCRKPLPKPLADQIRCHLHFHVTPRAVRHWRKLAQALSRHPERFRFHHPDYDQFDLSLEENVIAFLNRLGYDPRRSDAAYVQFAERLLWTFWRDNAHLARWRGRVLPVSLEQEMEARGDSALENALGLQGLPAENGAAWLETDWEEWLFHALLKEGWPEYKARAVVLQVFADWDYAGLSEYLQTAWQQAVKPTTIRKWVSRDLPKVGRRLLGEEGKPGPGSSPASVSQNASSGHSYHRHRQKENRENQYAAENSLSSGGRHAARSVSTCARPARPCSRLDRGDRPGLLQRGP